MMKTIIEISQELIDLENQLEELADNCEATEEAAERISQIIATFPDKLESTQAERDRKLDNYAGLINELQSRVEIRRSEAKRLSDRASVDENKVKALKSNLQKFFEAHQLKSIDTNRFRLTLAKNGGKLPLFLDSQPAENYPEQYRQTVTVTSPNREAIRAALEAGESLDFARLGDRGQSLRIK
jgi:chromosome segregation ATPase